MKPVWEWTEQDVQALIDNKIPEAIDSEYKACGALSRQEPSKRRDISKDISAFANSAGGTIIYGVIEDKYIPTTIDTGYDPREITKEWLEQIINTTIHPRIDGIRIKQIERTESNQGRVIYAVHVPQSIRAHMAADNRFYKRYNFESTPMEEYEVRDVMNRAAGPSLYVELDVRARCENVDNDNVKTGLKVTIGNESDNIAEYYTVSLFIDEGLELDAKPLMKLLKSVTVQNDEFGTVPLNHYKQHFKIPSSTPIYSGEMIMLWDTYIKMYRGNQEYRIGWRVNAPRMVPKIKMYRLTISFESRINRYNTKLEPLAEQPILSPL